MSWKIFKQNNSQFETKKQSFVFGWANDKALTG